MDVAKLKKLGGKEWKNYGCHRVYFNNLGELLNFKREINTITLDGKQIDISEAALIQNAILNGKFWYDVEKEKFYGPNLKVENYNLKELLIEKIENLIKPDIILEDELFEI